jgi:hypothetical protein
MIDKFIAAQLLGDNAEELIQRKRAHYKNKQT